MGARLRNRVAFRQQKVGCGRGPDWFPISIARRFRADDCTPMRRFGVGLQPAHHHVGRRGAVRRRIGTSHVVTMSAPTLDFWLEFGSTYSYPAAMRIARLS